MKLPKVRKHYYLGMAVNYSSGEWFRHLFTIGRRKDCDALIRFLNRKYNGKTMLCKNGRSALALALKAYFEPGDEILVNGFTCYAVYEAIKAAGLKPIFVDIDRSTLNFTIDTLSNKSVVLDDSRLASSRSSTDAESSESEAVRSNGSKIVGEPRNNGRERSRPRDDWSRIRGIIIQNTLGNPVDIKTVEAFAQEHGLTIIEDLAHCAGVRYPNKREVGTVGAATVLSFGKDKSIDTVSGGAVVLRDPCKHEIKAPNLRPRISDHLRARFYPMFGAMSRGLTYLGLGGVLMRCLVKIHWVERSADNKLDLVRKPSKFEVRAALKQLRELRKNGEPALRDFCFVNDREKVLKELQGEGYYFGGLWYEKPVSPLRYYQKVHFPESECPNAVYAAKHIVNLPNYYTRRDLARAYKIIKKHLEEGNDGTK